MWNRSHAATLAINVGPPREIGFLQIKSPPSAVNQKTALYSLCHSINLNSDAQTRSWAYTRKNTFLLEGYFKVVTFPCLERAGNSHLIVNTLNRGTSSWVFSTIFRRTQESASEARRRLLVSPPPKMKAPLCCLSRRRKWTPQKSQGTPAAR